MPLYVLFGVLVNAALVNAVAGKVRVGTNMSGNLDAAVETCLISEQAV